MDYISPLAHKFIPTALEQQPLKAEQKLIMVYHWCVNFPAVVSFDHPSETQTQFEKPVKTNSKSWVQILICSPKQTMVYWQVWIS